MDICWKCLLPWKGTASCGNGESCSDIDWKNNLLLNCGTRDVSTSLKNVPALRACPNPECNILVERVEGCKHIKCKSCKVDFCYSCLDMRSNGKWKCGAAYGPCPNGVAKRQTL